MPKGDWYCPLCKAVIGEDDERAAAQAANHNPNPRPNPDPNPNPNPHPHQAAAQLDGATPQGPFEATCAPLGAMNADRASAPSVGAQWEARVKLRLRLRLRVRLSLTLVALSLTLTLTRTRTLTRRAVGGDGRGPPIVIGPWIPPPPAARGCKADRSRGHPSRGRAAVRRVPLVAAPGAGRT